MLRVLLFTQRKKQYGANVFFEFKSVKLHERESNILKAVCIYINNIIRDCHFEGELQSNH